MVFRRSKTKAASKASAAKRSGAIAKKMAAHARKRKAAAKKALATAVKNAPRVRPPSGVWRHCEKTHRAVRRECERLVAVARANAEINDLGGDDAAKAYHGGRADAFLWALSAMDAIEAAAKGRSV